MSITPTEEWLGIQPLAKHLRCSLRMIYKLKADEVFVPGVHFYCIGNGLVRGKCIYNLQACREALLEKTKELAKNKSIQQPEIYKDDQIKQLIEKTIQRGHQQP